MVSRRPHRDGPGPPRHAVRCVLAIGRRARRGAVGLGHRDQAGENAVEILMQQFEGVAHLQHERGIEDVLRRRALVERRFQLRRQELLDGLHERDRRDAGKRGRLSQSGEIECIGLDRLDGCGQARRASPSPACARARAASVRSIAASRARRRTRRASALSRRAATGQAGSSDEKAMSAPETPCFGRHCSSRAETT